MKKFLFLTLLALTFAAGCASSDSAAVVIGMQNSRKYGICPGSAVDAQKMTKLLKKNCRNVTTLTDKQATKQKVLEALARAASKDLLIIYYSGHGGQSSHGDASEADGKDEYLCLYDAPLYDNELWSIIGTAKRTFIIVDACHSETMYRALQLHASLQALTAKGEVDMLCWAGCPDSTYSYGDDTGGYFTKTILTEYGRAKIPTYDRVWSFITSDQRLRQHQTPIRTSFGRHWDGLVFH